LASTGSKTTLWPLGQAPFFKLRKCEEILLSTLHKDQTNVRSYSPNCVERLNLHVSVFLLLIIPSFIEAMTSLLRQRYLKKRFLAYF